MMPGLLLDTQVFFWLNREPERVAPSLVARIDRADAVYLSAASAWELEIKRAMGKLRFDGQVGSLMSRGGVLELPVTVHHAESAAQLPLHHKDPFDRMLVAQALAEGLTLVTADRRLSRYPVAILQA